MNQAFHCLNTNVRLHRFRFQITFQTSVKIVQNTVTSLEMMRELIHVPLAKNEKQSIAVHIPLAQHILDLRKSLKLSMAGKTSLFSTW